jgi:hypothetical protein
MRGPFFCATSRRDLIRLRPASRIAPPESHAGSRVNMSKRAISARVVQPGRDDDLAFRFGQDTGVAAMLFLAIASQPLGNVRRAISLVDDAHERIASVAHIGTNAYAKYHAAWFEGHCHVWMAPADQGLFRSIASLSSEAESAWIPLVPNASVEWMIAQFFFPSVATPKAAITRPE